MLLLSARSSSGCIVKTVKLPGGQTYTPSWHHFLKLKTFPVFICPPFTGGQCAALISMSYLLTKKVHLSIFFLY